MTESPAITPIPVQLSEPEFVAFIFPHLSMPRRGPKCKLGYHRVFNRKPCSVTLGVVMISRWLFGCPVPRHQFIDAVLRPAVDEPCQQVRKIDLRVNAIEFAGFNQ
jgi:hypothetical protein